MAIAIKLPDMGTNVEECKVQSWRVREGATVRRGEVLAEIETDKAIAELESTAEGVLLRQVVGAGEIARTGDILAYVGQPGEDTPEVIAATKTPSVVARAGPEAKRSPSERREGRALRVSPIVHNLAAKHGVDLSTIEGTGSGGIITREDVLRAGHAAPAPAQAPAGEQLSRTQAAVARAVLRSWKEIPHLYVAATIDMTAAQRIRAENQISDNRPSYDAIFLKAMGRAIAALPRVGARLKGERVVRPEGIHIALAIDAADDLFLPVIRNVDRKDLHTLQAEIVDIASQVRRGILKAEQMAGGCMALSNLGMYPVEEFDAIIFPEHSAILAVGSVQKKPVVVDDRVEVRPMVTAKLAADHRLLNGRTAAEFLSKVKQIIESGDFV